MILRLPSYCSEFRCIADRCKDNCCIGWEIDIDSETAEYYRSVRGELGERLSRNIKNENGISSFILNGERCPFLNSRNLCDIIIEEGENHLCQICTDHPRYFEWYGKIKEGGIGLCCEEAARIILSQTEPISFSETEVSDPEDDSFDNGLYNYLVSCREELISLIENKNVSLSAALRTLLQAGAEIQNSVDSYDYIIPSLTSDSPLPQLNISSLLKFLLTLEPMDKAWMPLIKDALENCESLSNEPLIKADTEQYLRNIAVYFIWRYLLKASFDEDVISKITLTVISVVLTAFLYENHRFTHGALTQEDCTLIAKAYSKEIEYCEENADSIGNILLII